MFLPNFQKITFWGATRLVSQKFATSGSAEIHIFWFLAFLSNHWPETESCGFQYYQMWLFCKYGQIITILLGIMAF